MGMRVLLLVRPTYQPCLVLATFALLVTGCGSKGLDRPPPKAPSHIRVTAPWRPGGRIPVRYTCDGAGAAPTISATTVPGERDQVVVMTDPDAPGGTFVHWTAWSGGQGRNSFGKTGYGPPCPPAGARPHRYVVVVYALRAKLGLPSGSPPERVLAAIRAKAIASGSVTGRFGH
jgi:phosphatidylethanolamine-binding protein (PEBP) family uncharacterized protein